jgi:hypothetical protein
MAEPSSVLPQLSPALTNMSAFGGHQSTELTQHYLGWAVARRSGHKDEEVIVSSADSHSSRYRVRPHARV